MHINIYIMAAPSALPLVSLPLVVVVVAQFLRERGVLLAVVVL